MSKEGTLSTPVASRRAPDVRPSSAGHLPSEDGRRRRWSRYGAGFFLLLFITVICLVYFGVDLKELHARIQKLHGGLVFLLMATLPVVGFPASLLYVVAGAKFGSGWGLLLAALSITINLLLTYLIAFSFLRRLVERVFNKLNHRMPRSDERTHVPVALLVALLPSVPYAIKNHSLALARIPLRIYLAVCVPVHLFTASLGIFFGDFTEKMTPARVLFLVAYACLLIATCRFAIKRIRAKSDPDLRD